MVGGGWKIKHSKHSSRFARANMHVRKELLQEDWVETFRRSERAEDGINFLHRNGCAPDDLGVVDIFDKCCQFGRNWPPTTVTSRWQHFRKVSQSGSTVKKNMKMKLYMCNLDFRYYFFQWTSHSVLVFRKKREKCKAKGKPSLCMHFRCFSLEEGSARKRGFLHPSTGSSESRREIFSQPCRSQRPPGL